MGSSKLILYVDALRALAARQTGPGGRTTIAPSVGDCLGRIAARIDFVSSGTEHSDGQEVSAQVEGTLCVSLDDEWLEVTGLREPTAWACEAWRRVQREADYRLRLPAEPGAQHWAMAIARLPGPLQMWQELSELLADHGRVTVDGPEGTMTLTHPVSGQLWFRVPFSPTDWQRFVARPLADQLANGLHVDTYTHLPQGVVDEVDEVVGSKEGPYLLIDGRRLLASARPTLPAAPAPPRRSARA